MNIPSEVYIVIGTLVVAKFGDIFKLIQTYAQSQSRQAQVETSLMTIQKDVGKLDQQIDKLQRDLNELFKRIK